MHVRRPALELLKSNEKKKKKKRPFHPRPVGKKESQICWINIEAFALLHVLRVSKRHHSICKYYGWDFKECLVFV